MAFLAIRLALWGEYGASEIEEDGALKKAIILCAPVWIAMGIP